MADLHPAYLVLGTDRAKVAKVIARLETHFHSDAIERHSAQKDNAKGIVDDFAMMGLLAERRLVVVQGVSADAKQGGWSADDVSRVIGYLKSPSPDVVLLLVADKLAGNSRLRKAFDGSRIIECPGPDSPEKLRAWVESLFAAAGSSGDRAAVRRLIERCCGIDPADKRAVGELGASALERVRTDVERVATYAGSDPITVAMVDELVVAHSDEKVWGLTDAWASGDRRSFLRYVEQLLDQREHPVRLVGTVGRHLKLVNDAHHLLRTMGPSQALQQLVDDGANKWGASKVVQQAQRVGTAQVDSALVRVALLDAELKGASTLAGRIGDDSAAGARIVLERGLLELV